MPVDDSNIQTMLDSLRLKITTLADQQTQIYNLLSRLEQIEKDGQGNVKMDSGTRIIMTGNRRQAVYDAVVTEFNALP